MLFINLFSIVLTENKLLTIEFCFVFQNYNSFKVFPGLIYGIIFHISEQKTKNTLIYLGIGNHVSISIYLFYSFPIY